MSPKLFFLERGQSPLPGQRVCARCIVKSDCDQYATNTKSEFGIWGGAVRSREPVGGVLTVERLASVATVSPPTFHGTKNDQEVKVLPLTLSASSVEQFLNCPAQYKARAIDKAPDLGGSAASLGTACHEAMEAWVQFEHHEGKYDNDWAVMKAFYDEAYWRIFTDGARYEEGVGLLKKWLARQDWSTKEVLSVESKDFFMLPTSAGDIKFNYIIDRLDRRKLDGAIEVVDYKTISRPLQPEDLKRKIQARAYALAMQLKYPTAERIWVTFDMLRYDAVGIVFSKEENRATWKFLRKTAEQILASDGTLETINETCRWCIRKSICVALNNHSSHGGTLGIVDPVVAAARYDELKNRIGGLQSEAAEMEKIVLDCMRNEDTDILEADTFDVSVFVAGRRHIDPERLATIVGPAIMAKYGDIKVTSVDAMMKNEHLTDDQKSLIRQMFTTTYSEPSIKIKKKAII